MYGWSGVDGGGGVDFVTFLLGRDAVANGLGDRVVRRPGPQHVFDVRLIEAEQAVPQLAVGRDTEAVATHAERAPDRRNEAHLPHAAAQHEPPGPALRLLSSPGD